MKFLKLVNISHICIYAEHFTLQNMSQHPDLLNILTESVFPEVSGNTRLKQALILSLFGGSSIADTQFPVREHIHILILGSRNSLNKNILLKCLTRTMPNCCYIVANASSVKLIGLTLNKKGQAIGEGALINKSKGTKQILIMTRQGY